MPRSQKPVFKVEQMAQLARMPGVSGEDGLYDVDIRIAMVLQGEEPADLNRVRELNEVSLSDYREYTTVLEGVVSGGNTPKQMPDGSYTLTLKHPVGSLRTLTLAPLKAKSRHLLRRVDQMEYAIDQSLTLLSAHTDLGLDVLNNLAVKDWYAANDVVSLFRREEPTL